MSDSRRALQNLHPYGDRDLTAIKMFLIDVFNVTFSTRCVFTFSPRQPPPTRGDARSPGGSEAAAPCLRKGDPAERSPAPSPCGGGAGGEGSKKYCILIDQINIMLV